MKVSRTLLALMIAGMSAIGPTASPALAASGPVYVPYTFEPIWMSLYDDRTEEAFFPAKGIAEYEGKEMAPGGYVRPPEGGFRGLPLTFFANGGMYSEDYTKKIFALIKIKITNNDSTRVSKSFDARDFFLENPHGNVFKPHPFTVATTHRLATPGEAVYMTMGFEVPPGIYTLVYKDQSSSGGQVLAEVWRYDVNINRTPLTMAGGLLLDIYQMTLGTAFKFLGALLFEQPDR